MKKVGVFILAAVTAFTGYAPAQAMPFAPVSQSNPSGIELIHHRPWHQGGPRHGWHDDGVRYGHYNGYRGYRYRREGYRRHSDGWWYPLAAFGAGMVIGGAIAAPPPPPRRVYTNASRAHADWCYAQYRSYRAYDNSFQPYYGPRQQCVSPYY